ncbi:MAG TPA: PilT/PilU family type 4a pilus ATPase [Acidimicrobiia bacterium]|nr:PilT/PilU family type 4a pilus ATPase [Acidimicrobiia bacterium]
MSASQQIGQVLLKRRAVDERVLADALEEEGRTGTPLPAILARTGVPEKELVAAIAEAVGLRFVDFGVTPLSPDAAEAIPADVARRHVALGVDWDGPDLVVAFADPTDAVGLDAVRAAAGCDVVAAAAVRADLMKALDAVYGPAPAGADAVSPLEVEMPSAPAEPTEPAVIHLDDLLEKVLELGASDLHLTVGTPPSVRVNGGLQRLEGFPELTSMQIREMLYAVLNQRHRESFENNLELDTSYSLPGKSRFRVNMFRQRDSVGAVLRVIPYEIVPLEKLGLPDSVRQFADLTRGLVLVTGPTGSGKSTTLASLIDIVNTTRPDHIMTVEDPIEFLHQHKRSVVNQREVGEDTHSFAEALKRVLRQDPDVILVGEMRDLETISTALTAAETGHLVFGTLHTQDAPQSIDRIIDVFPSHQQSQIRVQLAGALQGIVTQQLVPTADGRGRAVASEVLVVTPAIRNLIREAKIHQIYSLIQAGGKHGMVTMDQSLATLVKQGKISLDVALERSHDQDELRRLAGRA